MTWELICPDSKCPWRGLYPSKRRTCYVMSFNCNLTLVIPVISTDVMLSLSYSKIFGVGKFWRPTLRHGWYCSCHRTLAIIACWTWSMYSLLGSGCGLHFCSFLQFLYQEESMDAEYLRTIKWQSAGKTCLVVLNRTFYLRSNLAALRSRIWEKLRRHRQNNFQGRGSRSRTVTCTECDESPTWEPSGTRSKRDDLLFRFPTTDCLMKYFWAWLATWVGDLVCTNWRDMPRQSPCRLGPSMTLLQATWCLPINH